MQPRLRRWARGYALELAVASASCRVAVHAAWDRVRTHHLRAQARTDGSLYGRADFLLLCERSAAQAPFDVTFLPARSAVPGEPVYVLAKRGFAWRMLSCPIASDVLLWAHRTVFVKTPSAPLSGTVCIMPM